MQEPSFKLEKKLAGHLNSKNTVIRISKHWKKCEFVYFFDTEDSKTNSKKPRKCQLLVYLVYLL